MYFVLSKHELKCELISIGKQDPKDHADKILTEIRNKEQKSHISTIIF